MDPRNTLLRPDIEVFVLVGVRLYRDGIVDALRRDARFRVVGSAASLRTAREELDGLLSAPHVALLDLDLPEGVRRGARAARDLARRSPSSRSPSARPTTTSSPGPRPASPASSRAARSMGQLLDAMAAAVDDEVLCSPAVAGALLRRVASLSSDGAGRDGPPLTRREREIVRLIGDGLTNKEIARALHIELATVKNHVHNILEKLQRRATAPKRSSVARARGDLGQI